MQSSKPHPHTSRTAITDALHAASEGDELTIETEDGNREEYRVQHNDGRMIQFDDATKETWSVVRIETATLHELPHAHLKGFGPGSRIAKVWTEC